MIIYIIFISILINLKFDLNQICDYLLIMNVTENLTVNNATIYKIKTDDLLKMKILKPNCQRLVDDDKVKEIIKSSLEFNKENNHFNFSVSSPPNLHMLDDSLYLIDGQHRIQALEILYNKYSHNIEFFITIVKVDTMQELEYNYNMINKNTPLPDFSSFSNINKNIPEDASRAIKSKFPENWSLKPRCNRPNIYFNHFQESLAFIVEKLEIKNVDDLVNLILVYNFNISNWNLSDNSHFKASENCIKKVQETDFYLGLYPHKSTNVYGYKWAKEIVEQQTGVIIKEKPKKRKKAIPKKIKNDSWNKYVGKKVGETKCLCCRTTQIESKDFVAGHIISEANGGTITVDNIVPICNSCNLSMGTKNMDDFISEHYPENLSKFKKRDYTNSKGWFS